MTDPANSVENWQTARLLPHAKNSRRHSPKQVELLAESIRRYGWTVPVLVDEDGTIIAGHGRVMAAQMMKRDTVPVAVARGWTDEQKRAYLIADNRLTALGEWDEGVLLEELKALQSAGVAVADIGYTDGEIADLEAAVTGMVERTAASRYTQKIDAPLYVPSAECPPLSSLVERGRVEGLLREIDASDVPADVKEFLRLAAERHARFHFGRIAEYYAHAPAPVQRLMEASALVIIDTDRAIELGYLQMIEELADLALTEQGDAD